MTIRRSVVGAVLLAFGVVVAFAVHTAPARRLVLARAVAALQPSGILATIGQLDYNLLTLSFRARNVVLTAVGSDRPFFSADEVRVKVPWATITGPIAFEAIEIDNPGFTIVHDADGTLNLPGRAGTGSSPVTGHIDIGRLAVAGLRVHYEDRGSGVTVDARDGRVDLERVDGRSSTGRLSAPEVLIRTSSNQTKASTLDGRLSFDGQVLGVEDLSLDAPEGRALVDAKLALLPAFTVAALQYRGSLDLARLAPWIGADPAPSGSLTFSGTASGPLDRITTKVEVTGNEVQWSKLGGITVNASGVVSRSAAAIESFRAGIASGDVDGTAHIPFDEGSPGRARLAWRNVQVQPLLNTFGTGTPPRIGSRANGTASLDWTGQKMLTGRGTIANTLTASERSRGDLPLTGDATLTIADGAWHLTHEHRIARTAELTGAAEGHIDPDFPSESTLTGVADLNVSSVSDAIALTRSAGLISDVGQFSKLEGQASLTANLAGTIGAPSAAGNFNAASIRFGETGPSEATARYTATTDRILLESLALTLGSNTVAGTSAIDLETGTIRGELHGDLADAAQIAASVPAEWRPAGSARFDARIDGRLDNPSVTGEVTSEQLQLAGQTLQHIRSSVRLANRIVSVERLNLDQGEGALEGTGTYALETGRFSTHVKGAELTLAASENADLPVDARFDLDVNARGTFDEPEADGFVQFSRLIWEGFDVGATRVDLKTAGRHLEVSARAPDVSATVQARIAIAEPRTFSADASIDNASIAKLAGYGTEADTISFGGSVALHAHATGRLDAMADTTADLDIRLTDATVNGASIHLARPARLRYSTDAIVADDLELLIGRTTLAAAGRLGPGTTDSEALRVSLTGNLADLMPLARIGDADALDAAGAIDVQMRVTGRPRSPEITANVNVTSATVAKASMPPVTGINVNASYAGGMLDLREIRGAWQGASLTASGTAPAAILGDRLPEWYRQTLPPRKESARAVVRLGSMTPAMMSSFLESGALADVTGRIDATVALSASSVEIDGVEADVTLERAELSLAKVPLNQSRPTRLRLEDGRLRVVDWTWAGAGNRVNVTGGALLSGESPQLDLALAGTLDLRMLSAFSPEIATTGRAAFDMKLTGVADQPSIDGRMSIENGGLVVRNPRFAVTDLQGTLAFARDSVQIEDLTANANGGTLRITGDLQYPDWTLAGGSVAVRGRGLAVEVPEDLRSEVDADLRLDLAGRTPTLRGSLTVLRGSYREPISLAAQLLTGVQTRSIVPAAQAAPGFFDRVDLDIDVKTAEEVAVDNNYARIDMGANLRIVGTIQDPVPTGRLTIQEGGDVFLGGRTYDIVRGTVDFTNATRMEPTIDLAMQTRVQRYDITLEVSGTPETLKATLRSPGVSQAELVSLLLTGQRADLSAVTQPDIARGQLLMMLSGELLGFAGRAVGLDTVQLSQGLGAAASDFDLLATDTDPSARLTLGKHLSRNVEVLFSQALSESGDVTWIAIYRPIQAIEVRGATQDDGSRSYEFRHEFSFGGPDLPARRAAAERSVEQVAAVTISGSPGFAEEEIRKQLHLAAGSRFDFYRWQRDRDRLQRFYRERDFLEARIAARRASVPTADGKSGVALEYEIDRGPQTKLTIDGYAIPGSLVDEMEEAWMWAVFDGFLLDDLSSLTTEHLTGQGYLRAGVQATVVSEPDAAIKEIAIRIDPGTRFTSRKVVFLGQQALAGSALEAAVRASQAGATMWHDPSAVKAVVEQQYRQRGYLDVEVNVQPPNFDGQSAELPVHINEGRQYTVARVEVQGAHARSSEQITGVLGITSGSVFAPAALEPARRAVEVDYLREGYNNVRATVTTTVDNVHGSVDLLLNVEEGRQQVLAEIDVTGADVTRRSVIDRALDVEVGQPANQSEFFRAETRLYDTGAFRTADIGLVPLNPDEGGRVERVRAEVKLEELASYRFRYGFRVNDTITPIEIDRELRPALVLDFLRRNLFGHAISAGAAGQIEADRRLLRGVLTLPRFFRLPVTTNLFATTSREDFTPEGATPFVEDESSITAEQRFAISPKMGVSYSYEYSRTHVFEPDPLPGVPPLELQAKVARVTGTYAWDRRSDPFSPRKGWFHSSGVELGAKALGSDLRFVRYLVQQHYYHELHRRLVLASAARLGFGAGFDQDLIPSERFYAGGGTTIRGFAEDGIGDVDFFGDPKGGNSMLVLNQEARMFLFGWVHAVGFVDAGNVFPKAGDFSLTKLEAGAGGGLRINSPFALLRVDFGVPLTSRQRQPAGRWYFGIGHTF